MPKSKFQLLKSGDYVLLLVLGTALLMATFQLRKDDHQAGELLVRQNGRETLRLPLRLNRLIPVSGPLGITVIEIRQGQARVRQDPGPRQYCVRQGWLSRAGESAICLPNRVSIELLGKPSANDSLVY